MKELLLYLLLLLNATPDSAQQHSLLDSLRNNLEHSKAEDTSRVLALSGLAEYYGFVQFDSSLFYANQLSALSQKILAGLKGMSAKPIRPSMTARSVACSITTQVSGAMDRNPYIVFRRCPSVVPQATANATRTSSLGSSRR